jgi:hypothetical protein
MTAPNEAFTSQSNKLCSLKQERFTSACAELYQRLLVYLIPAKQG